MGVSCPVSGQLHIPSCCVPDTLKVQKLGCYLVKWVWGISLKHRNALIAVLLSLLLLIVCLLQAAIMEIVRNWYLPALADSYSSPTYTVYSAESHVLLNTVSLVNHE